MKWLPNKQVVWRLAPALLFLLFMLYSLVMAFVESVRSPSGYTLDYYVQLFQSKRLMDTLAYSVSITLISTVLSLLIGWWIVRTFTPLLERGLGKWLVWIPMLFPHFVWAYMVLLLLGQSGVLSSALGMMGMIEDRSAFPVIVQDTGGVGIILAYMWKEIPFVILLLLPVYLQLPKQYGEVISLLGGSKRHFFQTIEWPWVRPVLAETTLILIAFIFTAYEVPALMGVAYPQMTAVLAYDWFYGATWDERSFAFALLFMVALVLSILSLLIFIVTNRKRWLLSTGQHVR